jgi:hypothetical protein
VNKRNPITRGDSKVKSKKKRHVFLKFHDAYGTKVTLSVRPEAGDNLQINFDGGPPTRIPNSVVEVSKSQVMNLIVGLCEYLGHRKRR